ncbi:MAG: hypothetical protein SCK57_03195 [Bacillota bacterium]|nr:hypothetical protein [Bacillota bacterium]MDW7676645.1 hypothetical protein [Bacillota bacterium]
MDIIALDLTFLFQLFNVALLIGIIYFVYTLAVKLPKRLKQNEDKLDRIEKELEDINRKLVDK